MADSFTSSLLLRKPEINANQNAWGPLLNEDFGSDRIEEALVGYATYTLSGPKTLSRSNGETDEARMRVQAITGGTGGTVTIPAVAIWYWFINNASGDVTVTNGSASVIVPAGSSTSVFSPDGVALIVGLTKQYVDNASFSAALPGQAGNGGKVLTTDGSNATWNFVNLATGTTGTLPVVRGGTGVTTLAALKTGLALNNVENKSSATIRADFTAAANTYSGKQSLAPSAPGSAGLNLGQGAAPTTPVAGDVWETAAGLFYHDGTRTVSVGKWTQIGAPVATTSGTAQTLSPMPTAFGDLLILFRGVSITGTASLRIEISDDGSVWTPIRDLANSVEASMLVYGTLMFEGYRLGSGTMRFALNSALDRQFQTPLSPGPGVLLFRMDSGIGFVRISASTGSFDGGELLVFAR